jgi:TonB-linked SusC/RagA family outer membrane protein
MIKFYKQRWFRLGCFVLVVLLSVAEAFGQAKTIKGKVVDAENQPVIGASVQIKGTSTGTITDINGNYSVAASPKDVLVFTFIGYTSVQETVGARNLINVLLKESSVQMSDVVVVGFGTQKKANLTGAVANVDTKTLESRPITDVARGLQGVTPGLSIKSSTGDLGQNATFKLRGSSGSIGSGADKNGAGSPLILVDNVEVPSLLMINPDDVASISVLKDAASAAIYGARATWGVILITTKQGSKNQKTTVTYSGNMAWNTPTVTMDMADGPTTASFLMAINERANPANPSDANGGFVYANRSTIEKMKTWLATYGKQNLGEEIVQGRDYEIIGGKFYGYRTYNPTDLYLKKATPQMQHNLSVSGGGDKIGYNVSGGYLDQKGLLKVKSDSYTRFNLDASINATVSKWLDVRVKTMFAKSRLTTPFNLLNTASRYNAWYYMYRWSSFSPYGNIGGLPVKDAINATRQSNDNTTDTQLSRVNFGATFKIMDGLTFDADYTYSNQDTRATVVGGNFNALNTWGATTTTTPSGFNYGVVSSNTNYTEEDFMYEKTNAFNGYFTYKKKLKKHDIKLTAGMNVEDFVRNGYFAKKADLMVTTQNNLALASGTQTVGPVGSAYLTSSPLQWSTAGFFGRANYVFDDKYLVEVNARYDASSKFASSDRWTVFPSGSLGWRFTEESFMKPVKNVLTSGKLRASWGMLGNQSVAPTLFTSTLTTYAGTAVNSGGSLWYVNGANQVMTGNPSIISQGLTWEKVTTTDFGADLQFFNDFNASFDWYRRVTSDMITSGVAVPLTFGATPTVRNFGELRTDGWELQLDYRHTFANKLTLTLSAGLSDYIETITKWVQSTSYTGNRVNQRVGNVYGYKYDRLFTVDDFQRDAGGFLVSSGGRYQLQAGVPTQDKLGTNFSPGDVKYKDLNGDGTVNNGDGTVDNHGDMTLLGNSSPRYQYNFTIGAEWKGVDVKVFFQGVGKRKAWLASSATMPGYDSGNTPCLLSTQTSYWYTSNTTDPTKSNYFVSEVVNPEYPRAFNAGSGNTLNYQISDKFIQNLAYLRCKNIAVGYTLPTKVVKKVNIQKVRFYVSADNLFEFDHLKAPIDPETESVGDGIAYGRSYPFTRSYSCGLQVTF